MAIVNQSWLTVLKMSQYVFVFSDAILLCSWKFEFRYSTWITYWGNATSIVPGNSEAFDSYFRKYIKKYFLGTGQWMIVTTLHTAGIITINMLSGSLHSCLEVPNKVKINVYEIYLIKSIIKQL